MALRTYGREHNIIRLTQSQCRGCIKYPKIFLPNFCSNLTGKYIMGNVILFETYSVRKIFCNNGILAETLFLSKIFWRNYISSEKL